MLTCSLIQQRSLLFTGMFMQPAPLCHALLAGHDAYQLNRCVMIGLSQAYAIDAMLIRSGNSQRIASANLPTTSGAFGKPQLELAAGTILPLKWRSRRPPCLMN